MGPPGNPVNAIYRSVPPRPFSYTFSDILQTSLQARTPGHKASSRSKTAPVSSNSPEEYAERFRSRPTTRPAVIDFDGAGVRMYAGSGAVCRYNKPGFPAVRTRAGTQVPGKLKALAVGGLVAETLPPHPLTERGTACTSGLHLAPLGRPPDPDPDLLDPFCPLHLQKGNNNNNNAALRTLTPDVPATRHHGVRSSASSLRSRGGKSPSGSHYQSLAGGDTQGKSTGSSQLPTTSGTSDSQWQELSSSKLSTLDTLTFPAPPQALGDHPGYAQALVRSDDYDDLSELPKPKRILPRRDLPWVFRFKVKKELNALSKIMASKPVGPNAVAAVGPTA